MKLSSFKRPYQKVSWSTDSSTPKTSMMIGSAAKGFLTFAAISWTSYSLILLALANNDPLPPLSSTFIEISPTDVTSHFEQRWPSLHLPPWATKQINFNVPKEHEICFTHVGKTGGSSVGCSLGFPLHCGDGNRNSFSGNVGVGGNAGGDDASAQVEHHSPSLLAKLTTHTFHSDVYDCDDNTGYFLFVIRDPIDRAMSAFNYDKPDTDDFVKTPRWANRKSHFYFECPFYHMENFVQNGLRKEGGGTDRCKNWALQSLLGAEVGSRDSPDHWFYNYQYYLEAIPSDSKILTIRNEYIEEDIRSIENLFECPEEERLVLAKRVNKNTWADQADMYLSDNSISILCEVLCNEIQMYKKILDRSFNMSQEQLRVSLMELEAKCPREAISEECSDELPDIANKLREKRGY